MSLNLDSRLKDIASFVDKCDIVADIGTDHGYIPVYLLLEGKASKAYASDIAIGPLNKAKENIIKYNLEDKIIPILSDGLDKIPFDANTIIIAGMGGNLIASILSNRKYDYQTFILQPNLHEKVTRKAIVDNNYHIVDEKVSLAHNKFYEIIKIKKGHQDLSELELTYGPINLIKKEPLFVQKWTSILNNYKRILTDFKGSNDEYNRIFHNIKEIESILNN